MIPETRGYDYNPGTCNIGKTEVRRRYKIGFIGLGSMIFIILVIELLSLPSFFKIFLFIPAFYFTSGFIQAFNKFCYVYGLKGVASLVGRKKFQKVSDAENFRADRKKAFNLITIVTLCSLALTIIYFMI